MSSRIVTVGIVGCGKISKMHSESIKAAGLRIGAVCDADAARAENLKREHGTEQTRVYSDVDKLLADSEIDVVSILTPPCFHQAQTVAALQAGKHVYCEKPVVKVLKEFDAIFAAEKSSGKKAFFTPGRFRGSEVPAVKQYVDAGDLGNIYRVEAKHWRGRGRPGVDGGGASPWFADSKLALSGIMGDMGFYHIDRSMYLTGWPRVTSVSATMFREFPYTPAPGVNYDVEEHVLLHVRTDGKLTFSFEFANIAYFDNWTTNTLMMLGNKGGIHVTNGRHEEFRFVTEKGGPGNFVTHRVDFKERRRTDEIIYEEFAALVQGKGEVKTATSSREALIMHEILAMAYLSSHERREVRPEDLDRAKQIFIKP